MKYNEIMKYDAAINEKAALGRRAPGPPASHHGVMRWSVLTRIKWPTSCGCCSFSLFGNHRPRLNAVSCEGMSLTRSWTKGDASCRKSEHERNEIFMNIKYKKWFFCVFEFCFPCLSESLHSCPKWSSCWVDVLTTWHGPPFVACVFGSLHPFKLRVIHVSFTNGLQSHSQGRGFALCFAFVKRTLRQPVTILGVRQLRTHYKMWQA